MRSVANIDRKPYKPLTYLIYELMVPLGFEFIQEIIWYKGDSVANRTTAWGTYCSPARPILRDCHEYLLVFTKLGSAGEMVSLPRTTNEKIPKELFHELTKSVWTINPSNYEQRKVHPVPFPMELARRCIILYSDKGHTVLDPFAGSGTVAAASKELERNSISYEIHPRYYNLIEKIISQNSLERWFTDLDIQSMEAVK